MFDVRNRTVAILICEQTPMFMTDILKRTTVGSQNGGWFVCEIPRFSGNPSLVISASVQCCMHAAGGIDPMELLVMAINGQLIVAQYQLIICSIRERDVCNILVIVHVIVIDGKITCADQYQFSRLSTIRY